MLLLIMFVVCFDFESETERTTNSILFSAGEWYGSNASVLPVSRLSECCVIGDCISSIIVSRFRLFLSWLGYER